jgi:hypothetical protein
MIPPDHERRIKAAIQQVLILCLCAVVPPLFSLTGIFRPEDEPLGQWFQRAGIAMTVFAVLAHFKAAGIAATMIAGGTFTETWEAYHKYNRLQALAAWLSLVLIVIGAVIWRMGICSSPSPLMTPKNRQRSFGADRRPASVASLIHPRLNGWKGRGPKKAYKRNETSPSPIINKKSAAQR